MAKSYRELEKDGTIKRADAMKVRIHDLHEEPGFNLREEGAELDESIAVLADFIAAGGQVPALEVRPREDGGVWIVDGHRRSRAYRKLLEEGRAVLDKNGELWIAVVASVAVNNVARTVRVMTSDEKRSLSDLERAAGYKRLASWGLKAAEIAKEVERSRPHVEQMLILANADRDVQDLVRAGKVTASTAIEAVRKHGEKAGALLGGKLKEKGGGKLKQSDVKGKALPRKLVDEVADKITFVHGELDGKQRKALAMVEKEPAKYADEIIQIRAGTLLEVFQAAQLILDERRRQQEKDAEKAAAAGQASIEGADE
jgi:ParB family transcriptional regulator, chromosome partitioning protein